MGMRRSSRKGKEFNPETLSLGYGYDPALSEGAVKPPVFLTSTFQFASAENGKRFFELAYGLKEKQRGEIPGLIYSRINNPNLQIFEDRMAAWDKTEKACVFSSGMSAISTSLLSLVKPGEWIISSSPVYGGTHYLFEHILPKFDIHVRLVPGGNETPALMRKAIQEIGADKVRMLFIETPANPSNVLIDIAAVTALAKEYNTKRERKMLTVADNTFLGPLFQQPASLGVDCVLYSATKFIGGHSDLVAGVVSGSAALIDEIMVYRTILGTMADPFTGWLLLRSLETLSIRMRRQAKSAQKLAELLQEHPKVKEVHYPGLLREGDPQWEIYQRQCSGAGSLILFEVEGGEKEAYKVLNRFEVFRLAVSLGGTESLVEHPQTMTHADVSPDELAAINVRPGHIRMSVGIEHFTDLKNDLLEALEAL